jgi:hypothetical protein
MRALVAFAVIAVVASFASAYKYSLFTGANCTGTATTVSLPEECSPLRSNNVLVAYTQATCGTSLVTRRYNTSDSSCAGTPTTTPTTAPVGVCIPLGLGTASYRYECSASSVAFAAVVIVASVVAMLI